MVSFRQLPRTPHRQPTLQELLTNQDLLDDEFDGQIDMQDSHLRALELSNQFHSTRHN